MEKIKNTLVQAGLLGVLIFAVSYFTTWWAGAVVAFLYAAFKKDMTAGQAFAAGTSAGLLVWSFYAGFLNYANAGVMAARIGEMVSKGFLTSANMLQITGVIGGLVCGLGAMTGATARDLLYDTRLKFGAKN